MNRLYKYIQEIITEETAKSLDSDSLWLPENFNELIEKKYPAYAIPDEEWNEGSIAWWMHAESIEDAWKKRNREILGDKRLATAKTASGVGSDTIGVGGAALMFGAGVLADMLGGSGLVTFTLKALGAKGIFLSIGHEALKKGGFDTKLRKEFQKAIRWDEKLLKSIKESEAEAVENAYMEYFWDMIKNKPHAHFGQEFEDINDFYLRTAESEMLQPTGARKVRVPSQDEKDLAKLIATNPSAGISNRLRGRDSREAQTGMRQLSQNELRKYIRSLLAETSDDYSSSMEATLAMLVVDQAEDNGAEQALMMFEPMALSDDPEYQVDLDLLAAEIARRLQPHTEKYQKYDGVNKFGVAVDWQNRVMEVIKFATGDGINRSFRPSWDSWEKGNAAEMLAPTLRQTVRAWKKKEQGKPVITEHEEEQVVRECIRELLAEDAMGFVHDLAAADEQFGEEGIPFAGGDPGKGGGKAIKRAFSANADHKWLSALDTVHWGNIYGIAELVGKSKDELSTTMTLPNEAFVPAGNNSGLWVKGRITLAANDMDRVYTGLYGDYGPGKEGTEEEVAHRDRSSGRNKRPMVSKDYSRYGKLKRGNKHHELIARQTPYILDQSMWNKESSATNEALVDNWRAVGIIPEWEIIQILKKQNKGRDVEDELEEIPPGKLGQVMKLAQEFGVPIFDRNRNVLWSPE